MRWLIVFFNKVKKDRVIIRSIMVYDSFVKVSKVGGKTNIVK